MRSSSEWNLLNVSRSFKYVSLISLFLKPNSFFALALLKLAPLKSHYLKGELILDKYRCPKTVETDNNHLENIFLLTNLFYDYTTDTIYKGIGSSTAVLYNKMSSLTLCGLDKQIISGEIIDNRIIIQ